MLVITDIKIKEMDDTELDHFTNSVLLEKGSTIEELKVRLFPFRKNVSSFIKDKHSRFKNLTAIENRLLYIGWSKQVENSLGVPLNIINELQKEISNSYTQLIEINALWMREKDKIRIFNNLSFWKKFLLIFKKETIKEK